MRFSRLGVFVIIVATVLMGTGCGPLNRVFARKDLVDGATAYKERKFDEAEQLFRSAIERDPELESDEAKTAQLFLARTLHSQFVSNRKDVAKAEAAIAEYKKALDKTPSEQSAFKAVASLLDNLKRGDEWLKWVTERSASEKVPADMRAEAFTSLAAKQYSCANEISDVEPVKQTINEGGKQIFKFNKPTNAGDFEKLKSCAQTGLTLIDNALALQKQANVESDSTWSYKANLLIQMMRIAEMDGNTADKDRYKQEADVAKEKFSQLAAAKRKLEEEAAAKKAAEEEAKTGKKPEQQQ